jgi:hypothetical protein
MVVPLGWLDAKFSTAGGPPPVEKQFVTPLGPVLQFWPPLKLGKRTP